MIFHDRKTIFIHIARSAGSSAELWLGRNEETATVNDINMGCCYGFSNDVAIWLQHATAKTMKRLYPDSFDNYFKWAIVRNPYSRMASVYRFGFYWLRAIDTSFEEFIMELPDRVNNASLGYGCPINGSHFTSQYDHTHIDNKLVCKIVRFENLPEGLPVKYGKGEFPKTNSAPVELDPCLYNDDMKEIIYKVYKKDFDIFGYDR